MTTYQAGDPITLRLHVAPEDGVPTDNSTTATVVVTNDAGVVRMPAAYPNTDRSEWTAVLTEATAGVWDVLWRITGTGAGVETDTVVVAPTAAPTGRVYATTGDLTDLTGQAPPVNARRLLIRASRKIDQRLRTAVYPVDDNGMPTDPQHRDAMREATCEQLVWWAETGDRRGTGAVAALAGAQIGTVKLPGGGGAAGSIPELAPAAEEALAAAGLLNHGPQIGGREGALRW